jgi:hypothetical protein
MFLQRSEAGKAFHMVRESTRSNVSTVFWATGALNGSAQTIEIPVDSVTQRLTFTFSGDTKGSKVALVQPSGGTLAANTASLEITELNCGRIVTVISPEPGNWRAEITGSGRFWLEAQAQSDIFFIKAEFVKVGGRPGHEGLFRIQGQPLLGAPATLEVSLSAKATQTAEFHLVNERGEPLQNLRMHEENADREFLEMEGTVELPAVPFRVAVTGRDVNGRPYQRFFANVFHAESVEVTPKLDFDELAPGETKRAIFTVRNIGVARTFRITVTDARTFVSRVEPRELALGAGESGAVTVELTVPAGIAAATGDDLVFLAASTSGPSTSNSSVVRLAVSSPKTP